MADNVKKTSKIEKMLQLIQKKLTEYRILFDADGENNSDELRQIDELEAKLIKANAKITAMKHSSLMAIPDSDNKTDQEKIEDWVKNNKSKIDPILMFSENYAEIVKLIRQDIDSIFSDQYIEDLVKELIGQQHASPTPTVVNWEEPVKEWLKTIDLKLFKINCYETGGLIDIEKYQQEKAKLIEDIRSNVPETAEIIDYQIGTVIEEWIRADNDAAFNNFLDSPQAQAANKIHTSADKLFSTLKQFGKFKWDFNSGKLVLKLSGKFALNAGYETGEEGEQKANGGAKVKILGNDKKNLKGEVTLGEKAKVKLVGEMDLDLGIFQYASAAAYAKFKYSGGFKGWGAELVLSSSNPKKAYYTHKAAELTVKTMEAAVKSLKDVKNILETEDDSPKRTKRIEQRMSTIESDLDNLEKLLQEPVEDKSEIAVIFGASGKGGDFQITAGMVITF